MIRFPFRQLLIICLLGLLLLIPAAGKAQQAPVVRAVLFYSPTCPHCHDVINEVLLPMVEEHGDRLQIVAVDVTQAGGQMIYQSAVDYLEIPEERLAVPTLVVGDIVLVGSGEIPAQFPGIVSEGLVDGIDWPAIPAFDPPDEAADPTARPVQTTAPAKTATPMLAATPLATTVAAVTPATGQPLPTPEMRPTETPETHSAPLILEGPQPQLVLEGPGDPPADPLGFTLAAVILVAMVIACAYVAWGLIIPVGGGRLVERVTTARDLSWAIPLLSVLGIGIAAYLLYVEANEIPAACGPVGRCTWVQASPYARILDIPIALLGLVTYVAIIGLWFLERLVKQDAQKRAARIGLIGLTVIGTLFSIYLALLELFVIHAVCAWCLTSAVIIMLLMVLVIRPATQKDELAAG
jgi:uncharacterized membrane protein/thiol-disulfide isomerase/thioredoxin